MTKKVAFIGLVVLILGLFLPSGATAGSSPAIIESAIDVDFPASIVFSITAASDENVTDIRLHYTVDRMAYARVVSEIPLIFTPSREVNAQWVWDMRMSGGMPPGSSIDCWWTVTDAGAQTLETAPERIVIEDDRYDWHNIKQGNVTLYWYEGDAAFADELMDAVQAALSRLSLNTGAELEDPVRLYIYASAADLQGSMIFPQEWTGGVAFTQYGAIAIGIPPGASGLEWGRRAIAHELTHLVVHQVTFNPYNALPTWLDEGLAMVAEGELESQFTDIFNEARNDSELISLRSLSSPFSAYTYQSLLSYAESHQVVAYLIGEFGRDKMLALLNTFARGSDYDEALVEVYGFDMDGLNAAWLAYEGAAVH